MKKTLTLLLALVLMLSLFVSCGKQQKENTPKDTTDPQATTDTPKEEAPEKVNVYTLMGPTGMGMAKLIDDNANGMTQNKYEFNVVSSPDQITPEVIKGNYDIAAVPVNLASVLFNKSEGKLKVAAVNTLGVLYMLENGNSVNSIEDLRGKTVYATGQGSTPEYILRYVLSKNNIDPDKDVKIEFITEHAELTAKMSQGKSVIGMLPEPNVTAVLSANKDARIALDMTKEWDKISDSKLIQGCIIVNNEFASKYPAALQKFCDEYKASVNFINGNIDEAATLIEKAGIVPKAAVAKKALPNCNICFISGDEMKTSVSAMLNILFESNPKAVGGKLPLDEFYY